MRGEKNKSADKTQQKMFFPHHHTPKLIIRVGQVFVDYRCCQKSISACEFLSTMQLLKLSKTIPAFEYSSAVCGVVVLDWG